MLSGASGRCGRGRERCSPWLPPPMRSSTWPSSSSASNRRIYSTGVGSRSITTLEALEEELERFEPQVVICGGHEDVEANSRPAWIELSLDPTQPTKISVGARYLERINPGVEALVEVIDELE